MSKYVQRPGKWVQCEPESVLGVFMAKDTEVTLQGTDKTDPGVKAQ